jgi:hypothetical protein
MEENGPKFPYTLNINNFNTNTLSDGKIIFNSNSSITKKDDNSAIKIYFPYGSESRYFNLNLYELFNIDVGKTFIIEYDILLPQVHINYAGLCSQNIGNVSSLTRTPYCTPQGVFFIKSAVSNLVNNKDSNLNYSDTYCNRYNVPFTTPTNVKIKINTLNNHCQFFINDELYFEYTIDFFTYIFTVNNGANEATNCTVELHSLKLYYE